MTWASHRRPRRRKGLLVDSAQRQAKLQHCRSLRFETLESRRLLDASQFLINEVLVNPHGADAGQEFIEIRATAGGAVTIPAGTYLLGIESDTYAANPGDVQNIFNLSGLATGTSGILVLVQKGNSYAVAPSATKVANTGSGTGWGNGSTSSLGHTADGVMVDIENTSMTLMLVFAPAAPTLSTDIDANNDGAADGAEYSSWTVLDSIGLLDGENNDLGYGAINFRMGSAGSSQGNVVEVDFNAGYVARKGIASGATADDWVAGYVGGTANNWTLAQVSDPDYAGQALNHVGSANPNTNPLLAHTAGVYAEGSSQAISSADLQATDLEQSPAALRFTVNSLPVHGLLQKDSTPLAVGDKFTQADVDAGHISYTHDGGETTSDGFDFGVVDGAGGSASGTFAITITPVNDLPTLTANLGLAIDEDLLAPITASLLHAVDIESISEQMTYTLATAPAHGTLAKNGVPLAASETFTQHDIDLGLITYQHNGDVALADQFTFTVADSGGGTIDLATFAITIAQFNLPPAIAANEPTVAAVEGVAATTSGTFSDPDGDSVILTASVGAVVNNGDGTWSWSYTPSDGPEDSQTVTVTIDDGLATAQATFALDVANAAPVVAANVSEVTAVEGETAANTGTVADVAGDPVTLTASVGTVTSNGDGTWSWSWNTADGPEDSQTVTITADDGLVTSQTTFALNVTNAAPAIAANNAEVTVAEGETATNSGTFADVVGDTVTLTASIGAVVDNGDGIWSWSFVTADGPEDSQTVVITVDDGLSASQVSFALTVANAAPSISVNNAEVAASEGGTATNSGTFADVVGDTVTLTASIGAVVDNGDGTWSWSFVTADGPEDSQTVTITADDGLVTSQTTFVLSVTNAAPSIAANNAEITVAEGETATNSGTVADVVSDAVMLTASIGAVVDHGDGTWSWSFVTADGPEDSQTVTITADDGTATSVATFTLTVTNTAPTGGAALSIVTVEAGQTATNTGTYADVAGDIVTLTASIGTVTDHGDGTWSWSCDTTGLPEYAHTVAITADDGLATTEFTFTLEVVDTTPEIEAAASAVTVSEGETATNSGIVEYFVAESLVLSASVGAVTNNGDGTWSWNYTTTDGPEDSQTVTITATDGVATAQVTFTLDVTNAAPNIAANLSEVVVTEDETAINSGTFADVAADVVTLSVSIGIVTDNGDGTWSWSYATTDGPEDSQTVTITADDGLATSQITFAVTVNNSAPTIAANASEATVTEGETASNSGTFADVAADAVTLSASIGAVIDNGDGTWSWSYTTTDGPEDSQTVIVTADDGASQSQTTFALTVNNAAPTIAANASEVTVAESEIASNFGTFADVAADTVTLSASIGTIVDNGDGTWSWSYTTTDGPEDSQTVTITADDGTAQSQVAFAMTVNNAAPTIAANLNEVVVTEGETATNVGTFGDVGVGIVSLSASIGAAIDNGDGTWTWSHPTTSAALDAGPVTITATDSDNLLATVVFNLVVNAPVGGGAGSFASDGDAESLSNDSQSDFLVALDGAFAELGSGLL